MWKDKTARCFVDSDDQFGIIDDKGYSIVFSEKGESELLDCLNQRVPPKEKIDQPELVTLEQYDRIVFAHNRLGQSNSDPHPNGIACPKCGSELWDSCPGEYFTTSPMLKSVHCVKCKHKGTRRVIYRD